MSAPALLIAVPLLAGAVAGAFLSIAPRLLFAAVGLAWACAAVAMWRARGVFLFAIGGACVVIGMALGSQAVRDTAHPSLVAWYQSTQPSDPIELAGVLRDDAARLPNGVSATIDVTGAAARSISGAVRLTVLGSLAAVAAEEWRAGRMVRVTASVREPLDYRDPGVPSDRDRLARQGIVLLGSVKSAALVHVEGRGGFVSERAAVLRGWVRRATADAVGHWDTKTAGVVTAILIGDRTGLEPDDERRLQDAGTYHVIAISGENIALLTAMLIAIGRALRLPARGTAAGSILLLLFYGYTAGLAPSVMRATVAGVVYLSARAADHRGAVVNALAVAAAFAAATSPLTVFDPGFLLSFGATLAILLAASRVAPPLASERGARRMRAWSRWLLVQGRTLGAATLCAEIALAPVAARLFGRVSFAGLLLNFAAIPLMSVIEIAGLAAVLLAAIWRAPALACGWVAHVATAGLLRSAALVDRAPWLVVDVPAPAMWLIVLWYAGWCALLVSRRTVVRRPAVAIIAISGVLIVYAPPAATAYHGPNRPGGWTRVAMFDVGQGDATLVWPAGAAPILIDGGGAPGPSFDLGRRVTVPAAWALDVRRLAALVLTHGDPDHVGGAPAVVRGLHPAEVWTGVPVPRDETMRRLQELAAANRIPWLEKRSGEVIRAGAATLRVLNPAPPEWERQKVRNDDSVVLELRIGEVAIVLPGDITRSVEASVVSRFEPAALVIVKAPHHGSAGSSSQAWVDALHPAVVLFSAGRRNPFGHPAPAVVDRYRRAGAHVFSTGEDGAVVIDTDGGEVRVWTWGRRGEVLVAPHGPTAQNGPTAKHKGH
jgi:competence protein ComEC